MVKEDPGIVPKWPNISGIWRWRENMMHISPVLVDDSTLWRAHRWCRRWLIISEKMGFQQLEQGLRWKPADLGEDHHADTKHLPSGALPKIGRWWRWKILWGHPSPTDKSESQIMLCSFLVYKGPWFIFTSLACGPKNDALALHPVF